MEEQARLLEDLKRILHHRKTNTYFASKLSVTEEEVAWAREELKKQGYIAGRMTKDSLGTEVVQQWQEEIEKQFPGIEWTESTSTTGIPVKSSFQEDLEKGTAEATFTLPEEIKTLEDLVQKCGIDTERWAISKYVQNYWGNSSNPHWQVKAWLSSKTAHLSELDLLDKLLKNYKGSFYAIEKKDILINDAYTRPSCLLLSLADFHLDKKTLDGKTLEEKAALYSSVIDKLLYKAWRTHLLEEIVFVLGNDFMHVDSYHNTTTNLTPQDTLTSWHNAYEKGFDLMVKTIAKLRQFCEKLTVVHVPSNHGRTKEFYMAHGLQLMFQQDKSIVFDRTADNTKVFTYGECFIGLHHGDTDMNKLPLYFASKYYQDWGRCKHKEIALADKHHRKEWKYSLSQGEVEGIRMFITPSLSGTDKWHKDKNYDLAVKAGIARVYDKEWGYCTEFEERI